MEELSSKRNAREVLRRSVIARAGISGSLDEYDIALREAQCRAASHLKRARQALENAKPVSLVVRSTFGDSTITDDLLCSLRDEKGWLKNLIIGTFADCLHSSDSRFLSVDVGFFHNSENRIVQTAGERFKHLAAAHVVVFPINTNNTHWTLIAVDCQHFEICHYDSIGKATGSPTKARRISELIKLVTQHLIKVDGARFAQVEWTVHENAPCYKQSNTWDCTCGVFVCYYMSRLVTFIRETSDTQRLPEALAASPPFTPVTFRREIEEILEKNAL